MNRSLRFVPFIAAAAAPTLARPTGGPVWSTSIGAPGPNAEVNTLLAADLGSGPSLYAGGAFTAVGGNSAPYMARWNGASWSPAGTGLTAPVLCLAVHDAGSGAALYAGGSFFFRAPDGFSHSYARLTDGAWDTFGAGGPFSWTGHIASFDDGHGLQLYISGGFSFPGSTYIARWNSVTWSGVGGGLSSVVHDSIVHDDGSGRALFITGSFPDAGALSVNFIAKWNGQAWAALGTGLASPGSALAVFDDGTGPALYAAGAFPRAGNAGPNSRGVARWDGAAWHPLASGIPGEVNALAVFDDGSGPKLYAGGSFSTAGNAPASRLARWDGANWSQVLGGITGTRVTALEVFDRDGPGPAPAALYVAGLFTAAGGRPASNIAAIVPCPADFNTDARVDSADFFAFLNAFFAGIADFNADGITTSQDFFDYLTAFFAGCN